MTPTKWIEQTNAIGIVSKAGRYGGGTYAHSDIAMAFATWISPELTPEQIAYTYASEADLLNVALFGQTAKQWKNNNPSKKGNVRDDANLNQLLVLANMESMKMQDFGVNLICVEDGIDSSKDAGKLMISVLSAVAEIERENIRVQTMEGRMQKAREGKWNGGFAPYGYSLIDGKLEVNEEEAVAIRTIFDQYVNTDLGANGIAKYLENHGIHKIARQNGTNPLFDAALIRRIIQNPVYCGKSLMVGDVQKRFMVQGMSIGRTQ